MNPESARRFGPYEIKSRLGGGGMGHVYRAWDARLHREVAIKLLNHEFAMPGMRERFLREARAASALNHPNICTVFDIGEQDGDPYLVMELLHGETLKDRILKHTMQLDEIVSVARDAAEALVAAHLKGVVHRDIKPANIFLVEKPNGGTQAKILDFGLAKIGEGTLGSRGRSLDITTVGATVGTLAYMSPEQARGEPLDARSDLFSLGVVLYEMATRHVPFQGATSALVFVQLLNHEPEPVREWNDAVPRELEKIIFKLLAKERTARFQTAHELEVALVALSEKGSGGGWLRKAVASVPLVRAQDPVAREKRPTRNRVSSDPGLQALPLRPTAPISSSAVPAGRTEENPSGSSAGDQVLRPVVRKPRSDATPNPGRNTPVPTNGVVSTFSPVPPASRLSEDLSPSRRRAGGRLPPLATESKASSEPSVLGAQRESDPILAAQLATGDRNAVHVPESSANGAAMPDGAASTRNVTVKFPWDEADELSSELDDTFPPLFSPNRPRLRRQLRLERRWIAITVIIVIMLACLFFFLNRSRFAAAPLNKSDSVVLTEIENRTGDKSLNNSVTEALRFELAQSSYFSLRSGTSYQAARRFIALTGPESAPEAGGMLARKAAERLGAKAYLSGFLSGSSAPYTLHIELRQVGSGEVLVSVESHADSLQEIPAAVDQLAIELRSAVGESRSSIEATSIPLAHEASINLTAVQLYADAMSLIADRELMGALADLQQAATLDPKFIQAHLQLASLYRQLRAETAAGDSAQLARAAAGGAGERTRTLAEAIYDRDATGDYAHATALLRHLVNLYPHDAEAMTLLAEMLRLQGHMAEALNDAQQATFEDPFNAFAYRQAQLALIGLDRFDAAYQAGLQAQRLDLGRPGDMLAAAALGGREDVVDDLIADLPVGKFEYRPDWPYGIYLDDAGRLTAGAALWRSRAEAANQNDSLRSAATYLLSQGALDRALLGDCASALAMLPGSAEGDSHAAGRAALFDLGVTAALCGDRERANRSAAALRQRFPRSFEVNGYFLADIQAAEDLRDNRPAEALADLAPARAFDLISITPYLRGRAHVAQHEVAVGIVDFQTVLAHPGVTYLAGGDVYPASQIGVARAFADSGDLGNSAEAYRKFLALWANADPGNPLLIEARAHVRP
jgi:serine/threonine protein kinase